MKLTFQISADSSRHKAVRERPILFNAAMVRAVLAGTKSQTRRVITRQPPAGADFHSLANVGHPWHDLYGHNGDAVHRVDCPFGAPGDRLWVRETFAHHIDAMAATSELAGPWVYAADGEQALQRRLDDRWRPSIHMPRPACRLLLEVTDVRVKRLQDISEADAQAEGAERRDPVWPIPACPDRGTHRAGFEALWESINGPSSWAANPWVWVVEFRRIQP